MGSARPRLRDARRNQRRRRQPLLPLGRAGPARGPARRRDASVERDTHGAMRRSRDTLHHEDWPRSKGPRRPPESPRLRDRRSCPCCRESIIQFLYVPIAVLVFCTVPVRLPVENVGFAPVACNSLRLMWALPQVNETVVRLKCDRARQTRVIRPDNSGQDRRKEFPNGLQRVAVSHDVSSNGRSR